MEGIGSERYGLGDLAGDELDEEEEKGHGEHARDAHLVGKVTAAAEFALLVRMAMITVSMSVTVTAGATMTVAVIVATFVAVAVTVAVTVSVTLAMGGGSNCSSLCHGSHLDRAVV